MKFKSDIPEYLHFENWKLYLIVYVEQWMLSNIDSWHAPEKSRFFMHDRSYIFSAVSNEKKNVCAGSCD